MNFRLVCTVAALAAFLGACGAKDLDPNQAKSLLNDDFKKNPIVQPLLTGMDNIGTATEAAYFNTPGGKYQKALEAGGLIQIVSKGKIYKPGETGPKREYFNALDIQLTDKGKTFVTGKPNTVPAPSANTWPTVYENVTFCGKEVKDITVNTNDDFARADYSWHAANLSPFATAFQATDSTDKTTCNPSVMENASATFERHDDAWKLSTAQ